MFHVHLFICLCAPEARCCSILNISSMMMHISIFNIGILPFFWYIHYNDPFYMYVSLFCMWIAQTQPPAQRNQQIYHFIFFLYTKFRNNNSFDVWTMLSVSSRTEPTKLLEEKEYEQKEDINETCNTYCWMYAVFAIWIHVVLVSMMHHHGSERKPM